MQFIVCLEPYFVVFNSYSDKSLSISVSELLLETTDPLCSPTVSLDTYNI